MAEKNVFDKEEFKKDVCNNVKTLFRRTIDEADKQQIFQAVAYSVKDYVIDEWIETQKAFEEQKCKKVLYMSMEFLMGRALGNTMINLTYYDKMKEALNNWFSKLYHEPELKKLTISNNSWY